MKYIPSGDENSWFYPDSEKTAILRTLEITWEISVTNAKRVLGCQLSDSLKAASSSDVWLGIFQIN